MITPLVLSKHAQSRVNFRFPNCNVNGYWKKAKKMTKRQLKILGKRAGTKSADYFISDNYLVFVGRFYDNHFLAFTVLKYNDSSYYKAKNLRVKLKKNRR